MVNQQQSSRRHRRLKAGIPIRVKTRAGTVDMHTTDVGKYGIGLHTDRSLGLFGLVDLEIDTPRGHPISLTGMIAHQRRPDMRGEPVRTGVHLHFFGDYRADDWHRILSQLEAREELQRSEGVQWDRFKTRRFRKLIWNVERRRAPGRD